MQSSYRLIKNEFAKQGESKLISTEYVSKNPKVEEELEEIEEEIKAPEIDPEELLKDMKILDKEYCRMQIMRSKLLF